MANEHPNISLLKRFDPRNLAGTADLFTEDFVWHFFNPRLPEIQGDYVGVAGLQDLFEKLGAVTGGTFQVEPVSVTPCGDELVTTYSKNRMTLEGRTIEVNVVVVWRIVGGRIAEVWDIPSVYTAQLLTQD